MTCDEAQRLLDLDADGELDLVRHVELAEHIKLCADCAARAEAIAARKTALRTKLSRHTPSSAFSAKLRGSIAPAAVEPAKRETKRRPFAGIIYLSRAAGLAAMVALSLVIGYNFGNRHGESNRLVSEAIDSHVRSLEAGPLMEVISTDQHTVKPWFAGKLDFSPPVLDLASEGFPLIGARRARLGGQTVAALVFHRHQHTINLYMWPAKMVMPTTPFEQSGLHAERWTNDGLAFLAVSDVGAADLVQFAKAYHRTD